MENAVLYTSLGLFSASVAVSMLPVLFKRAKSFKTILPYTIVTSAGFMLSSIFTDFIPHTMDAHHGSSEDGHKHFSAGLCCSGLSFIALLAIDVLVLQHSHCDNKRPSGKRHAQDTDNNTGSLESCTDVIKYSTSKTQAFLFLIAISVHSFF